MLVLCCLRRLCTGRLFSHLCLVVVVTWISMNAMISQINQLMQSMSSFQFEVSNRLAVLESRENVQQSVLLDGGTPQNCGESYDPSHGGSFNRLGAEYAKVDPQEMRFMFLVRVKNGCQLAQFRIAGHGYQSREQEMRVSIPMCSHYARGACWFRNDWQLKYLRRCLGQQRS